MAGGLRDGDRECAGRGRLLGRTGLWLGIGWRAIGIAAAVGFVLYFGAGRVGAHLGVRDFKNGPVPVGLLALAVVMLVLAVASA